MYVVQYEMKYFLLLIGILKVIMLLALALEKFNKQSIGF